MSYYLGKPLNSLSMLLSSDYVSVKNEGFGILTE